MDIYLIAIGGTGMAPLACLLQELGHRVRGADGPLYPPMSDLLGDAGIRPHVGWDPDHLDPRPDLVIVGNAVARDNPEALEVERSGIERISMPEALYRFFLADRDPLVVAGTHGKTTTSSMAAWTLRETGDDPGYLIGGIPLGLDGSFAAGSGSWFVVEGDEYNAAYFDRGPKFRHYRPRLLVLTSVEHDHADLYPRAEDLLAAYRDLVGGLPPDGVLVAVDDPGVLEVAAEAPCRVVVAGLGPDADVGPVGPVGAAREGTSCRAKVISGEEVDLAVSLPGRHNLSNALCVLAAMEAAGVEPAVAAEALGRFRGVRRRLEEIGEAAGVLVVDDFAHHPTAVRATLGAIRQRYPERRIVAAYEPRSLTAGRAFLLDAYREAFATADSVVVAPVFHRDRFAPDEILDRRRLAEALADAGVEVHCPVSAAETLEAIFGVAGPGDVVVTMSSGDFEGMPRRLLDLLADGR